MKKILVLIIVLFLIAPLTRSHGQEAELRLANEAWLEGKYPDALRAYLRMLKNPTGDSFVDAIARQTGELYHTYEITDDGRFPKMSLDGSVVAYETGVVPAAVTRIVSVANRSVVAELSGTGAALSPSGKKVAYLKLPQHDELKKAQADLEKAQGTARFAALQNLNYFQAKHAVIVLRNLVTGQEAELATSGLLKSSLVFGDEETVYFVGAREGETARNEIYTVNASASVAAVTSGEGFKIQPTFDASGKLLIYAIPLSTPFPAPRQLDATAQQQGGQRGGGQAGPPPGAPLAASKFGVMELASRKTTIINGTALTAATDGSAVTYLVRAGQETSVMLHPIGGEATAVLKTNDRVDSPSFSLDGQRLIYSRMTKDDWELFLIGRDGKNETRLTREIQHDVQPRFLAKDRVLGLIGEPRHRRAYLYDLANNTRTQLFHNNTVRTISPEVLWQPSADGSRLLIQADRDGNTVSPERGVYVVDLNRKVTKAELIARLEKQLADETALRVEGQRIFTPITPEIRRALEQGSVNRVYEHEKALFDFDSKHISRPGNKLAIEYLTAAYKSFGYDAEQQCFENRGALGGKTCNVIAKLTGTENPELIYVVSSHFDSVQAGPGADDDTSGTAALLEAARMLAKHPQPATIIFASFTGEEAGLLGSREFVRVAQEKKLNIVGALNNDMIGWANDNRLDNTIRYSNDGIRDIQHAAAFLFTRLITFDARWHRGTDATAFFEVYGDIVGGIGSYPVLGNPHYHQATDLLETINHQLILETSKTTAATLMMLASSPSRLKDLKVESYDGSTAELSWTASPEKNIRGYLVSYAGAKQPTKVSTPRVSLKNIPPGTVVSVKAVNARGLEGWDWARVTVKTK
ncbi:MAG: M20/M25/M40 family metallo-hydrolase [Acidobacteriota bacterium]|nr:M20/M25/M40 family metallo-hydrolase [Acidobacteriota bacterium]